MDLAVQGGQATRRKKSGLSGKQQLFKLKSVRATTAGEIPPDYITIEGQIPFKAPLPVYDWEVTGPLQSSLLKLRLLVSGQAMKPAKAIKL